MKTVVLRDICELITKGTTPTTLGFSFTDTGVNFIKIENIDAIGNIKIENISHINSDCHLALKRSQLKKGDILFSIAGAIGRTAIVDDSILPANTNQALAIIRLKDEDVNREYLRCFLSSRAVIKQTERQKQGVAQINLSLKNIGDLIIKLPNYQEQLDIVNNIKTFSSLINNKKSQLLALDELVKSRFIELFEKEE
ncbi:MAG: restriction endonuclease subunit S, partial [Clostridia bacterium]|nr:restriction endonuclease subunit S [Clostridia bacterium]